MSEFDYEEAYYWWSINDVCELIRQYGYTKVLIDIDKSLRNQDLEVTLKNTIPDSLEDSYFVTKDFKE
jgi:hypothetical protein